MPLNSRNFIVAITGPDFADSVREGENLYTGSVVVLDAKTGDYKNHFKLVPKHWHDWDISNTPALIHAQGGKQLMPVAPKDGYLYGIDLATNTMLYRTPVTKFENATAPFEAGKPVHFCPGSAGQNGTGLPTIRRPTSFLSARSNGAQTLAEVYAFVGRFRL